MSETKKRNTHLPEFKAKVGLEAVRGVMTVYQMAQEFGVHPVQVGQWKRDIQVPRVPQWLRHHGRAADWPGEILCVLQRLEAALGSGKSNTRRARVRHQNRKILLFRQPAPMKSTSCDVI